MVHAELRDEEACPSACQPTGRVASSLALHALCLLGVDSTGNLNKKCRAEGNSPSLTWSA